jgi:hypothetical protein
MEAEVQFDKVRRQAILDSLFSLALGRRDDLISFEDAKNIVKPTAESYRGLQTIEVSKIVGSEGRYADFNRRFLPRKSVGRRRWSNIYIAHQKEVELPAIQVYELGGYYFIRDGNHRVSVAYQTGKMYIEAQVTSLATEIPLDSIKGIEDLKRAVLEYEHTRFMESLQSFQFPPDTDIRFTATGRYDDIALHIACHRQVRAGDKERRSYDSAVQSWFESIYLPFTAFIRDSGVLKFVPNRTEADFYVWMVRHWDEIAVSRGHVLLPNRRLRRRFLPNR